MIVATISADGIQPVTLTSQRFVATIGSSPWNDFVLPAAGVAAHHASVRQYGARFVVTDDRAPRGTLPTVLDPGASMRVGPYELRFSSVPEPTAQEPEPATERNPGERRSLPILRASQHAADDTEQQFLQAIEAKPDDDEARVVYADWLEENGRAQEAEFLRVQLELKGLRAVHPRFRPLSERLRTLAKSQSAAWRAAVARPVIEKCDLRYELVCPRTWDSLTPTQDPGVRHCGTCAKHVHFATSVDQARDLAVEGECVAVDVALLRAPGDLDPVPSDRPIMMGAIAPPSDWPRG